ncbi:MAG TPA: hypothetical protein DDY13_12665 [Cytophagales bacterium]|jgi:hypothetical protein|nr:hypothetical protein [Cytophagales bacterium]
MVDVFQTEECKKYYSRLFNDNSNIVEGHELYVPKLQENEKLIRKMGSIMRPPVLKDHHVLFGTTAGKLYCIALIQ